MSAKSVFLLILFIKAILMSLIIHFSGIGLGPDEAQYFTWSRHLDLGYYSKPPGIAWQIFLSTSLFGATEFGVRSSALVLGTLFSLAVYRLSKVSGLTDREAAVSGIISSLTPIGIFATFLAITDGGLLLFWTLALIPLVKAIRENETPSYLLLGMLIAAGALFKWPIFIFWGVVLSAWIFFPKLRSWKILGGVFLSLLGLLPTLYWNMRHDFATFRHVFATVQGGSGGSANPLEFLLSQAALLFPIFFVLLILGLFYAKDKTIRFLGGITVGIVTLYTVYACFKKGQGNWCLFAYPTAFVFIAAAFPKGRGALWIKIGCVISPLLALFVFAIPIIQSHSYLKPLEIPWKMNPFRQNVGLDRLKKALEGRSGFLAGDKYQTVSLLSFYNPEEKDAFFFNLMGIRKNQFSFWPGPKKGENALFVVIENASELERLKAFYPEVLAPYFEKVREAEVVPLFEAYGKTVKGALFFQCDGFNGQLPQDPEKY